MLYAPPYSSIENSLSFGNVYKSNGLDLQLCSNLPQRCFQFSSVDCWLRFLQYLQYSGAVRKRASSLCYRISSSNFFA